jgi:hypothetical protein
MRILNFIASTLFIAGAICRISDGEYLEAALGFCCAIQMWVIEYLRFILEEERKLREACNHLALKTLEDLSEEFKKKHREQLERQKGNGKN